MEELRITKPPDLGAVMKAAREDQQLTQSDLAELLGTDRFYIGDLEAGKPSLQLTRVFRILNSLGVELTAT
ncbi:MAG: helix-turn-helix domain-containing protein, partial [Candidatus Nanopelagicales bacterium]